MLQQLALIPDHGQPISAARRHCANFTWDLCTEGCLSQSSPDEEPTREEPTSETPATDDDIRDGEDEIPDVSDPRHTDDENGDLDEKDQQGSGSVSIYHILHPSENS